jgi:hypothetical protein
MFAPFTSEELYDLTKNRKLVVSLMRTTYKLYLLIFGIFIFLLVYAFFST